jgi:hypothetical protein
VVEDTIVLRGRLEILKAILERTAKAELPPAMRVGLKQTGLASAFTLVFDLEAMPARERKSLLKSLEKLAPGVADILGDLHVLTATANDSGKVTATATLLCKDAASAAQAKKIAATALDALKAEIKDDPRVPPSAQELRKEVWAVLGAIKLSTKENQVNAEVTVEAAAAVRFNRGLFEVGSVEEKKVESFKEKK